MDAFNSRNNHRFANDGMGIIMTDKEKQSEMDEIFNFKYALTKKINNNTKVILRVESNGQNSLEKNKLLAIYRKCLKTQITERNKLSANKVALQLGVKGTYIEAYYRKFVEAKEDKGLSFRDYQALLKI